MENKEIKIKYHKKIKINFLSAIPILFIESILLVVVIFLFYHVEEQNVDSYFISSENVRVEIKDDYYFFDSKSDDTVFIYYPGAKIDERSYAPILRKCAEEGIDVYCPHMPYFLAFFDINRIDKILLNKNYSKVIVGGHSLGGAISARYVYNTTRKISGLALFGAFSDRDLTGKRDLKVFSTYGTRDEILNMNHYEEYKKNLPNLTELVVEGGNHSRCASYGDVFENPHDVISCEEQWKIMSEGLINWIKNI